MTAPEDPAPEDPAPEAPGPEARAPEDPHPPAGDERGDPPRGALPSGRASGPHPDDHEPEERVPGLARERTALAWTRTAIGFGALGGAVLKVNVVTGLIILAMAPVVWQIGRMSPRSAPGTDLPAAGTARIRLITLFILLVSVLSLLVALLGRSAPGALR
jgi:uncharacterized membrane protein YidH (DUF202 family)